MTCASCGARARMRSRLAYVHDHRYLRYGGRVYSTGTMSDEVWSRFLGGFDEVTVFASVTDATSPSEVNKLCVSDRPGVRFVHVPYVSSIQRFLSVHLRGEPVLTRELKKYDAVVVRLPGSLALNAVSVARRNGIPVAAEVVGCPFDAYWNHGDWRGKLLALFMYWRMRTVVNHLSHIVYVTEVFLQRRYPSPAKQINISNVKIESAPARLLTKKRERLSRGELPLILGLMGSMNVKYKGHVELLRALALVKDKLPSFRVELVGGGNADWIRVLAERQGLAEHIHIVGRLEPGREVLNWLDNVDVYVHPSKQEGLPRAVIEAMSRGCPVLASSVAGIPELLSPDYLHRPGDYKLLSKQLMQIMTDSNELLKMSLANVKTARRYGAERLQTRRSSFWNHFSSSVQQVD